MGSDFACSLLKSGISAAHKLASQSSFSTWKEIALNLFQSFQSQVSAMSIYTLNQESEEMEEEVLINNDGVISGADSVPLYQLPDELLVNLKPVQIDTGNICRTLVPLHQSGIIRGYIELHTQNKLSIDVIEGLCYMASALSLGVFVMVRQEIWSKDKYLFDAIMHINHEIQSCTSIDELLTTFSKLTIKFLKLDRLTIFIKENSGHEIVHNFCTNAKGEIHTLENVSDIPFDITSPKSLEDLSGYWLPIKYKKKTYGVMLADNIYTLSEISKDSITLLSDLCTQLALSIEHLRLINNINKHAQYDDLTGVLNRRMSIEAIEHYIALSKRNNNSFTLCYLDMNYMKMTNDKFGHLVGDDMLINFTQIIRDSLRQNDIVGRVGGDEFIVIFPACDIPTAEKIWSRIQEGFEQFNHTTSLPYKMSASHGMAQFNPEDEISPAQLIYIADKLMYKEKELKRPQ